MPPRYIVALLVLASPACGRVQKPRPILLKKYRLTLKSFMTADYMYADGEGVPQSYTEAAHWYRLAAAQGFPDAHFILGLWYGEGRGVPRDLVIAHMWINISGTNEDNWVAQEFLSSIRDRYEEQVTIAQIERATQLAHICMASDYQECGP